MYAVITTGGKQYRVSVGDKLNVEKLPAEKGETVVFDQVLLISGEEGVKVGRPTVEGATVEAEVLGNSKTRKVIVYKYHPKKRYRRKKGHRQQITTLGITGING